MVKFNTAVRVAIVGMSLVWTMLGCSSQKQVTILTSTIPPKTDVTELQSPPLEPEIIVQEPIKPIRDVGIPAIDIPVEDPARPTIRNIAPPEIFAASKTKEGSVEESFSPVSEEPESEQVPIEVAKVSPSTLEIPLSEKKEVFAETLVDIYFDYDRFNVRKDAIPTLEANAELLVAQFSDRTVLIEGHCDERGTQSYNIILGERRAQAVKKYLMDLGIPEENLQVISYGKDKPFCTDHSLKCWQENRRGHFVVK